MDTLSSLTLNSLPTPLILGTEYCSQVDMPVQVILELLQHAECNTIVSAGILRRGIFVGQRADGAEPFSLGIVIFLHLGDVTGSRVNHTIWLVAATELCLDHSPDVGEEHQLLFFQVCRQVARRLQKEPFHLHQLGMVHAMYLYDLLQEGGISLIFCVT